jgi:hypothetical protein
MSQNQDPRGPRDRQPPRGPQRPETPQQPFAASQPNVGGQQPNPAAQAPRAVPRRPAPPFPARAVVDESQYDEFWDTFEEAPARQSFTARLRRLPPFVVLFSAASFVAVAFLGLSLLSRNIDFHVLTAAAIVAGLVFVADTAAFGRIAYLAGEEGRSGRALILALAGGAAAVMAGLSFGWAAVTFFLGS